MSRAPYAICLLTLMTGCQDQGAAGVDAPLVDSALADVELADVDLPDRSGVAPLPAEIRELIELHLVRKDFMGVMLVARGEEVLLHEAHGLANQEWRIPHTLEGKFRLGSVSKQFTAAAVLLLEGEGKWRLEDRVKQYLPDAPAAWEAISLHHLLSHTSGIPDFVREPGHEATLPLPSPPEMTYRRFRDKPLAFPPGEKYEYSNSGYVLLALLIERVTGERFHDFLQRRVLDPLGLQDTGGDGQRAIIPRRVAGYTHVPGQHGTHRNAAYVDMSIPTGGGSLYSTSRDLLRWQQALFDGRLLPAAAVQRMTTAHVTTFGSNGYGYGLFIGKQNGRLRIAHPGSIHGFMAVVIHFPETRVTVVVLSNVGVGRPVDEIAMRLSEWAHGDPPAPFPEGGPPPTPSPDGGAPPESSPDAGPPDAG
jgi:CubicO group peptidase (beta-lactamase class C family)